MRYAPYPIPYKNEKTRFNRAVALFVEFNNDGYNRISQMSQITKIQLRKSKDKLHKQLHSTLLLLHATSLTI